MTYLDLIKESCEIFNFISLAAYAFKMAYPQEFVIAANITQAVTYSGIAAGWGYMLGKSKTKSRIEKDEKNLLMLRKTLPHLITSYQEMDSRNIEDLETQCIGCYDALSKKSKAIANKESMQYLGKPYYSTALLYLSDLFLQFHKNIPEPRSKQPLESLINLYADKIKEKDKDIDSLNSYKRMIHEYYFLTPPYYQARATISMFDLLGDYLDLKNPLLISTTHTTEEPDIYL